MTVYELAKEVPDETLGRLIAAGIISYTLKRNVDIFGEYNRLLNNGTPVMQAYSEIATGYGISESSVRKIISDFCKIV